MKKLSNTEAELKKKRCLNIKIVWLLLKNVSTKIYFSKNISSDHSHLCFDIQWHEFPGIKCIADVQELKYLNRTYYYFKFLLLKLKQKK